ncbi:MAG: hypothetical protein DRQ37_08100 [Gammaproteobacteria bacterium]|nr:MAG: hypothetical protein DRQ37_08100 [Gammaproteobacteria bacterium]
MSTSNMCHILESANHAILVADVETGLIVDANQRASELTGRAREELVGLHQTELHPPEERERYAVLFREHAQNGAVIFEDLYVQDANGMRIPVEISAWVMESEGHSSSLACFVTCAVAGRRRLTPGKARASCRP